MSKASFFSVVLAVVMVMIAGSDAVMVATGSKEGQKQMPGSPGNPDPVIERTYEAVMVATGSKEGQKQMPGSPGNPDPVIERTYEAVIA